MRTRSCSISGARRSVKRQRARQPKTQMELTQARASLREFMLAMNAWETAFFRARTEALENNKGTAEIDDGARAALESILAKWAVVDQGNFGRLVDLGAADPPTYHPDGDAEESAEVGQGVIQLVWVQRDGLQNRFRFTMKPFAGRWKIQKKANGRDPCSDQTIGSSVECNLTATPVSRRSIAC